MVFAIKPFKWKKNICKIRHWYKLQSFFPNWYLHRKVSVMTVFTCLDVFQNFVVQTNSFCDFSFIFILTFFEQNLHLNHIKLKIKYFQFCNCCKLVRRLSLMKCDTSLKIIKNLFCFIRALNENHPTLNLDIGRVTKTNNNTTD